MGCCHIDKSKFSLHHPDPGLFHSSQWSPPGITTLGYTLYRLTLAALMTAGITAHIIDFTGNNPGYKWLIYMTNQGILLLTLHYVLYASLVTANYLLPRGFTYTGSIPFLYKISWAMQNMTGSVAVFISLVYWTLLHPVVVENNLMSGTYKEFLNVFLHGLNSVSFLIDIFVTARPWRIHHFYFAIMFGLWYMGFSLVYWAAGGTGRCYYKHYNHLINTTTTLIPTTTTLSTTTTSLPVTESEWFCDPFIYPILDWGGKPLLAVGMILGGVLVMPLVQTFWWLCYKLRLLISARCGGGNSRNKHERIVLQNKTMAGEIKFEIGCSQGFFFITIIECMNLRNRSNTFVQLFLLPGHHQEILTKVVKKDANPLFMETIRFELPVESLFERKIVLHVIDNKNNKKGEVQIPLNSLDLNQISTFVRKIGPVTL